MYQKRNELNLERNKLFRQSEKSSLLGYNVEVARIHVGQVKKKQFQHTGLDTTEVMNDMFSNEN